MKHALNRPNLDTEIAIIGMSGRFPGARDVESLWRLSREMKSGIRDFTDRELLDSGVPKHLVSDPNYVRAKGYLEHADCLDARFFGISPREAAMTDPQHRVFLECAWAALERAGYVPREIDFPTGVFASCSFPVYLYDHFDRGERIWDQDEGYAKLIGNDKDFLATRVAYQLDLRGPAMDVQTACSSSLVAVISACTSLLTMQCDMAIAGGACVTTPLCAGYLYRPGMILSPDGRCRPFAKGANGTVLGNGVGIVVLKRLRDAVREGDPVLAIIRGFGLNNDGSNKAGFTAPSLEGQAEVIQSALNFAGLDPSEVGYIETHGTGTHLGDPIEFEALSRVFAAKKYRRPWCGIGALKANLGHLDAAAGVAGLIRATQVVAVGAIPGVVNFDQPNPEIDLGQSPFYIPQQSSSWVSDQPRIAGVSAFGIGGTNAHVLIEAGTHPSPPRRQREGRRRVYALPISAKTASAVESYANHLEAWLGVASNRAHERFEAVVDTFQTRRTVFEHRTAMIVSVDNTKVEFGAKLGPRVASKQTRVVMMFPGQGSQRVGACHELYRHEPRFRSLIRRCQDVLYTETGDDLLHHLYGDHPQQERDHALGETAIAQPVLFAIEVALARLWLDRGLKPDVVVGHSLGEYAAAVISGVFDLEDAMRLVIERGQLMQAMPRGSMLAIAASVETVAATLPPGVEVAAVNGPHLCVVAGSFEALEALCRDLDKAGHTFRRLRTSHAFHSSAMEGMLEQFKNRVAGVKRCPPTIPILSNVTGKVLSTQEALDPTYWAMHVRKTVRFYDGIRPYVENPSSVMIEVGPGQTLSRIVGSISPRVHVITSQSASIPDAQCAFVSAVSEAWCRGVDVQFEQPSGGGVAPVPTYPFARQRHWIDRREPVTNRADVDESRRGGPEDWMYHRAWVRAEHPGDVDIKKLAGDGECCLLVSDDPEVLTGLEQELRRAEVSTQTVLVSDAPSSTTMTVRADDSRGWDELAVSRTIRSVIFVSAPGGSRGVVWRPALSLARLATSLAGVQKPVKICVVAPNLFSVVSGDTPDPAAAALDTVGRLVQQSNPLMDGIIFDCGTFADLTAQVIVNEMWSGLRFGQVAVRGSQRFTTTIRRVKTTAKRPTFDASKRYVITGGTGGIGLCIAHWMVASGARHLCLTSRRGCTTPSEIDHLRAQGATVEVKRVDVTNASQMSALFSELRSDGRAIAGIIHAAGIFRQTLASDLSSEGFRELFAPKVVGAHNILHNLCGDETDFVACFSSLSVTVGGTGYIGYASANSAMEAVVARARENGTKTYCVSIQWPGWAKTGMARKAREPVQGAFVSPNEGVDTLARILGNKPTGTVIVSPIPPIETVARERMALDAAASEFASADGKSDSIGSTPVSQTIREVFGDALGVTLGLDDDFFDCGGHSLLAVGVASRLSARMGVTLSTHALIAHPTPRALAEHLASVRSRPAGDAIGRGLLVPLNRCTRGQPLFLIHPVGGTVFQYRALAKRLASRVPVWGIRSPGIEAGEQLAGDFGTLASRYADEIRLQQPHGPYRLGGHSLGGAMAYAVALYLHQMGESVAQIVMLDTPGPKEVDIDNLRTPAEIRDYLEVLAPQFWESIHTGGDGSGVDVERFVECFRFHCLAMHAYRLSQPSPAPILYLRAHSRDRFNVARPEREWIEVAEAGLDLRIVAGNHITMVFEPFVEHVAQVIAETLCRQEGASIDS